MPGYILKPGDRLTWRTPSGEEEWHKPLYKLWRERHGESVTFVSYAYKTDPYILHNKDVKGLPLLRVKTKVGEIVFSAGHFE